MTLVELEYPKIERIEGDDRYAKFACEPLPPGYGTTLGNSLRRVLLSSLEKEGPGVATAGDIATTSEIELVNPDVTIATLEPEASLWMELTVDKGKGFHSGERREGLPIGVIPIDALFSPVR